MQKKGFSIIMLGTKKFIKFLFPTVQKKLVTVFLIAKIFKNNDPFVYEVSFIVNFLEIICSILTFFS